MRSNFTLAVIAAMSLLAIPARAQLTSPQVGWQAELNGVYHNVGGTVTIVDDNTLRFDNFTFDGGGLDVRFYLGESDTQSSFVEGQAVGPQLLGMSFNGSQPPFSIDMSAGQTLEGWHAISVWCVDVSVSFGSGSFMEPPPFAGDFNLDGSVDAADYTTWRDGLGSTYEPMDYDKWTTNFGRSSSAGSGESSGTQAVRFAASVPEPVGGVLIAPAMLGALAAGVRSPRRRARRCGCGCSLPGAG